MKVLFRTLPIIFFIMGCGSSNNTSTAKCNKYLVNDYYSIIEDSFQPFNKNDINVYTQIKYTCVYSSLYIHKGMFDRFGKWDQMIKKKSSTLLFWNRVKLFESSDKDYFVITNSSETKGTIYTSVLVFDMLGNDLLSGNSPEKEKLKKYFGDLIRSNDSKNKDFYPAFWKEANPKKYKMLYE